MGEIRAASLGSSLECYNDWYCFVVGLNMKTRVVKKIISSISYEVSKPLSNNCKVYL